MRWGALTLAEIQVVKYPNGTCKWHVDVYPRQIRIAGKYAGTRGLVTGTYRTKKEAMDRAIAQMVIDRLEA